MAAPTLTLSDKPSKIDLEEIKIITVTTDASDFQVVSAGESLTVEKVLTEEAGVANKTFNLKGVKEGDPTKITVTASKDGEVTTVEFFCQCELTPTELVVGEIKKEIKVNERIEIPIKTNAGEYKVSIGNENVLRIVEQKIDKLILEGIGVGDSAIDIIANKKFSVEKRYTAAIKCTSTQSMDKEQLPTSLSLYNTTTKKRVTFTMANDTTSGDVTVYLPRTSGQLLTEESLGTDTGFIIKPSIVAPTDKTANYTGVFTSSPYKTALNYSGKLKYVHWQLSLTKDFNKIVVETKNGIKQGDGAYDIYNTTFSIYGAFFVRVRHIGDNGVESPWSEFIEVSIGIDGPNGLKTPKKIIKNTKLDDSYSKLENMYFGAYFGKVEHTKLIDDYDYRGNLETIISSYNKKYCLSNRDLNARVYNLVNGATQKIAERYPGLTNENSHNLPIYMRKGYQVTWKGKLYYATDNMMNEADATTGDGSKVITPETKGDKNKWKEDTRTNLATPRHVFWERVNIGFGNQSSNYDGYGSGEEKIGDLVNHEEGYLKYIYKGRLCYTTPKPICTNICWNDLAKVELWKKQRTVRLGGHLYYVRFMYEEEFKTLFDNLGNGTYIPTSEYKQSAYGLDKKVWLYDERFQNDDTKKVVRKAISLTNGDWVVEDVDPKLRTDMSLRLVLERCADGEAPYNNIEQIFGTLVPAENESFQYDPYTDTGYFGTTVQGAFGTTGDMASKLGVSITQTGHDNNNPYWLKFYWHGLILYMNKKPLSYNWQYQHAVNYNVITGVDMGGKDGKKLTVNGKNYRVALVTQWSQSPMRNNNTHYNTGSNTAEPWDNLATEQNKYSMYIELWPRVCRKYAGYDMSANPADNYSDHYNTDGNRYDIQRGDNWAEYSILDIIGSHRQGYGSFRRGREVGTYNGSKHYTGGYMYENVLRSTLHHSFSDASTNHSWAPCYIADTTFEGRSEP